MAYEDANSLTLTGYVSGDPEYVIGESGDEVCRFFVKFAFRYRTVDGWQSGDTELMCIHHRLSDWFRANICDGLRVCLQGRLMADAEGYFYLDLSYLKVI